MMHNLIEIMNEQAQRYEELLGLSLEKKDTIIKNDVEALKKITNLEHLLMSQNNKLEKKRMTLVDDICEVLGKRGKDITLGELIELLDGKEEQVALKEVGDRIRQTLDKLREVNELNHTLIESALEYVDYSINVIRSSAEPVLPTISIKGGQVTETYTSFDSRN